MRRDDIAIIIEKLGKEYRLGTIGGSTLSAELQSKWARWRGKEDPNVKLGESSDSYGESFWALKDINLEIHRGEAIGIIGHNGAGKSTLLKILSRVTAPTEGVVRMKGRVSSMLEVGTGFHPELTGRENIYMNGAILGMNRKEVDAKIDEIIDFSECRQFIDTPVKRYSSGMYVKLAFAVAAHLDAEIMIMDEVLAVGDMKFQQKCLGRMDGAAHEEGKTVLYVSHNMNTIRKLCNRCIVLSHGKIVYDGDVESAIEYYMESKPVALDQNHLDLIKRAPEFDNPNVLIRAIESADNGMNVYVGGAFTFKMLVNSARDYHDVQLRMILKTLDDMPVTMTTSSAGVVLKKDECSSVDVKMDLAGIAPGRYLISPVLYCVNEYGTQDALDGLKDCMMINILPKEGFNNNMEWTSKYWGNMYGCGLEIRNS